MYEHGSALSMSACPTYDPGIIKCWLLNILVSFTLCLSFQNDEYADLEWDFFISRQIVQSSPWQGLLLQMGWLTMAGSFCVKKAHTISRLQEGGHLDGELGNSGDSLWALVQNCDLI